jgi:hypothetical protein
LEFASFASLPFIRDRSPQAKSAARIFIKFPAIPMTRRGVAVDFSPIGNYDQSVLVAGLVWARQVSG